MMRTQQQTQSNESKSTFERRPSQRFASRRSRMDRTRPNITSSSSANKNNTKSSSSNNLHNDSNKTSANNMIETNSQVNQSKLACNDTPLGTVKPNIVINSGSSRHQILQSKPVKPPTVPPGASYGITQTKSTSQQPAVSINNNNIHHYLKDRQLADFSDCADVLVTTPSQEHAQSTNSNSNSNFLTHVNSKSQPNVPVKSHHYLNYKPPDSQPPPPPKPFYNKALKEQPRIINSEEEQQIAEASTVPARKPSRLSCSNSSEQHSESNHYNGIIQKHHLQQGEVINSSSMPPPPPPPHTMPRSVSNQALTNQANKQSAHHSQASIIKPICVTEL